MPKGVISSDMRVSGNLCAALGPRFSFKGPGHHRTHPNRTVNRITPFHRRSPYRARIS